MGTATLDDVQLSFSNPDKNLWTKSVICVRNVPSSLTKDEIALYFENKKIWGQELDVRQVNVDKTSGIAYVLFEKGKGRLILAHT